MVVKKGSSFKFSALAAIAVVALVASVGYFIVHRSHAAGADINGDGKVDIADLSILASHYGQSGQTFSTGDLNGDGSVGIADLSMLATAWGSTTPACTGVAMTNGQADIDSHPAGTTFCIAGLHTGWALTPKAGDQFIGDTSNPGILDGGGGATERIAFNAVVPNNNVVIQNLEIRNYTTQSQRGAIQAVNSEPTGWILRNLQVHDNGSVGAPPLGGDGPAGGAGANVGPGWQVLGGRYYNNRQEGLGGGGANGAVIDGVELDHNNFTDDTYSAANIDCGFEAGGYKWALTSSITIKNSKVHDNACKGLWADVEGNGAVITNNLVYNNWDSGIFIEISSGATVTGNTVHDNGFHSTFAPACTIFLWGTGILFAASDNSEVANNTVTNNCGGIGGIQQTRTHSDGSPALLQNLNIHNNSIVGPNGRSGQISDNGMDLTTRNIVWTSNTFTAGAIYCGYTC